MTCIRNTHQPVNQWIPGGIPLTRMMCMEERKGRLIPVIRKALVNLEDKPFQVYASHRKAWALNDDFRFPGPIQYFGPPEVCEQTPITLKLERD
jgi:pyrophosphate--fructose-6-phosphate 1-phosphotransferase